MDRGAAMTEPHPIAAAFTQMDDGIALRVKVVPGARRDHIAGMLGDRLKVTIAAPAEDGKANRALCRLFARRLEVAGRDVAVAAGHSGPMKTLHIRGIDPATAASRLSLMVDGD